MIARCVPAACLLLTALGCREPEPSLAHAGDIAVVSGFAFEPGLKTMTAFVALRNRGTQEDTLVAITTDIADTVRLHDTQPDGTGTRMVTLDRLVLPPQLAVEMTPGGLHLMLSGLRATLAPGQTLSIRMLFARAGRLDVLVPVEQTGTPP